MSGRRHPSPWTAVILATVITTLLAGCGGGGKGSDGDDAGGGGSGPATIRGVVTVNGEAVVGEDVTLGPGVAPEVDAEDGAAEPSETATEPTGPTSTTDGDGAFSFESLDPGSYSLSVGVTVEGAAFPEGGFGIAWDDPCRAQGFEVFNAAVSRDDTPFGAIASASNQANATNGLTPIEVSAGDDVTVDVAFECTLTSD